MQLLQTLLSAIHGGQAVLASYALYYSVISIQNLRKYEPKMKKAANYSNQAGEQLWMTRKTQGAAAIVVRSFLSSLNFKLEKLTNPTDSSLPPIFPNPGSPNIIPFLRTRMAPCVPQRSEHRHQPTHTLVRRWFLETQGEDPVHGGI